MQLALNVSDLSTAIEFYRTVFGAEPSKVRAGYANFAIADPPLKLVLFENPDVGAVGALNHLGVEVPSQHDVVAATERFTQLGLETRVSMKEECCHAVQDKVYVTANDVPLDAWEFYTVLDDSTEKGEAVCQSCG